MADVEQLRILEQGVEAWDAWRRDSPSVQVDLRNADLQGAKLKGVNLEKANLSGAKLRGADLREANLREADMGGANLSRADLRRANIGAAQLGGADLQGAKLELANCELAHLSRASLCGANLTAANLQGADLHMAKLEGADLRSATFNGSTLGHALLTGTHIDATTQFVTAGKEKETKVAGCVIDAYALYHLHNFGGFLPEQRANMVIRNDLADLRASYSGLRLWVHLIALSAFLLPYAWFLTTSYNMARFISVEGAETITLWEALGRFIWNGGDGWQAGWDFDPSFLAFVFLTIYNLGRGVLLWQTNRLEHREQITNIAVRFSLVAEPFWRMLINTMSVLFWVALGVLAFNTYHFMSQEIPITSPV